MSKPEWIKHDGSERCPVPYGHDVEARFRNGETGRYNRPEYWLWCEAGGLTITHYRDWTAHEEQQP